MNRIAMTALCGAAAATTAHAGTFEFFATIDDDQSVPATTSPATGTLSGTYDDVANTFSFSWSITDNLVGTPASPGAHLHRGAVGATGPVIFAFNNPDGTWALSGSAVWSGLTPADVDSLFAGEVYANFHTSTFAPGEVRGQLALVPAPASLAALLMGGGIAVRRRR